MSELPIRRGWRDVAWSTVATMVCCGYATMLIIGFGWPGIPAEQREKACLMGIAIGSILALVFGVMAATRRALPGPVRRAWWVLVVGFVALNLIPVGLDMDGQAGNMQTGGASWADLFRLAFVPPAVAALLMFPRRTNTHRSRYKIAFDMLTVMGGAFMVLWYFVIGHVLEKHYLSTIDLVAAVSYPIGDLVLIFGVLAVLLNGAEQTVRRPLGLTVGGLGFLIANDTYLGYLKGVSDGQVVPVDRWQYGSVALGMFLFTMAGIEQCRQARARELQANGGTELRRTSRLPYAALVGGYGLLLVVALQASLFPWGGLVIGAMIMTGGVAARQILALRENHDLVVTDSLTGLANRLQLHESLHRAVERAQRTGQPAAIMLLDMDGFKQVNDTLGHEAGDELLVGFAKILRANVLGSDTVARQGGDEFAIVLPTIGSAQNAEVVATRILEGMRQPILVAGQEICARASIGIAVTDPSVEVTAAGLLNHADLAMYRAKSRKDRGSNWERFIDGGTSDQPGAEIAAGDAAR